MNAILLTSWILCQSLDLGTTLHALNQPHFREGNPILGGPKRVLAFKVTVNGALFAWQARAKRPVLTRASSIAMASAGCVAGGLNLRTIRGAR